MSSQFNQKKISLLVALALSSASTATWAKSVIVELNEAPVAHKMFSERKAGTPLTDDQIQALRAELSVSQDQFLQALTANGISYTMEMAEVPDGAGGVQNFEYRYTLVFNGMNIDVADNALDALANMPQVKKVHDVRELTPQLDRSTAYTKAPELYGQIPELTAYDDHREGFEGQGMYVSVIDTGIDWSNEQFGGDATPPRIGVLPPLASANNNKVAYYLPLGGELLDQYGHGTHVAATAAGYLAYAPGSDGIPNTADDAPVHGVAPQAKIMAYQVCNGAGRCLNPSTIMAIEDSVSPRSLTGYTKPVADVINLSLGGPGGPDDSSAVAASNAALAGVVVVAAAGNDGPGDWTLGSPAAGRHVIAVGASNDPGVAANSIEVLDASGNVDTNAPTMVAAMSSDSNLQQELSEPVSGQYVYAGLADTPDQVPFTVMGNICLVMRGSTQDIAAADAGTGLFANKAANCQAKGAIATVIYNDTDEALGAVLAPAATPVFTISGVNGNYLQDLGYDATGVSVRSIQLNPIDSSLFEPGIAGFSSRGPILGLGQIKADIAAPGVEIYAATTKTSAPTATMSNPTGYGVASGTSMASPHVAGAAALVRQARPELSVSEVRAVLMNTSTNPRYNDGTPKADGVENDSILAQGAGLMDVYAAANATAMMGIEGDGIIEPEILGSYSFGTLPVINTRVTHSEPVSVSFKSLSDTAGTYRLTVANNRDLQVDGIDVALSTDEITVAAGGSTSFVVSAVIDGNKVRSTALNAEESLQTMWYVVATKTDGSETLRMPMYLKPEMSQPLQVAGNVSEVFYGSLIAGDNNAAAAPGVTYQDFPVDVSAGAFRLIGDLEYTSTLVDDIDLFLIDPSGTQIASSTNGGGPEHIEATIEQTGTYIWRVSGWVNGPVETTLTSTQALGGVAPVMSVNDSDLIDNQGNQIDFDGSVNLSWTSTGSEQAFEVEYSTDGENFSLLASVDGQTTSFTTDELDNGQHFFRVKALFTGKIGYYVSGASEAASVIVDQRSKVNLTGKVSTAISAVAFTNGVFSFDMAMTNDSSNDYVPHLDLAIRKIKSASGQVTVMNADNGGVGTKHDNAIFSYAGSIGSEQVFSAGETSDTRNLQFANPASELFQIYIKVTGHESTAGSTETASVATSESADEQDATLTEQLIELTINPVTGDIVSQLVTELP
jgi:minor extracellular serine protease Vpr